tara:strand:+ start:19398 stop:20378 length:981 start_codon:yes stop_codon:yes gene_type:complete
MKKVKFTLILVLSAIVSVNVSAQKSNEIFTMFYNVENFFDTIDDPKTDDNEFLPGSKKEWDTEKYNHKINQLTKVFSSINNNELPNIIGLCEIENKIVIDDLLSNPFFENHNYSIVHKNSTDNRGIDCALLYDNNFTLLDKDFIKIRIPDAERPTRDIVYTKFSFENEIIHVYVNHWPSRYGGEKKTQHKRDFTASVLRKHIEKKVKEDDFLIVMGDLNDYPNNNSVQNILVKESLTNLCLLKEWENRGSYNWDDKWGFLDQIIVSNNFLNKQSKLKAIDFDVLSEEWLLYEKKNGVSVPSRTYGRNTWYKGFSDHLPVYFVFSFN